VLTIGEQLRAARTSRGRSQQALATLLGTTQSAISEWERGEVDPGTATLGRIAEALNCELAITIVPRPVPTDEADADERGRVIVALAAERERQGLTCADIDVRLDAKPGMTEAVEAHLAVPCLSTLQRYARALGGRLVTDIEMPERQP
jgi:transcriptional regulator with XRE-family HTH domain